MESVSISIEDIIDVIGEAIGVSVTDIIGSFDPTDAQIISSICTGK